MTELRIALVGGGPSALFMYKRLIESNYPGHLVVDIYERTDTLGSGMPYSHNGAADEHVTNVSGNEIPELAGGVAEWVKKAPRDTLDKYHIDPDRFNDYKVLPRLLFGQYLASQFKTLLHQGRVKGIVTKVLFNTEVSDIQDLPEKECVVVVTAEGRQEYDRAVICTGHHWPRKHEGKLAGWFDSPYPPEKIAEQANHPVAVRGASLTAIDAIKTLARHNGRFEKDDEGILHFYAAPGSENFKIVMHTRNGLLPAVRFHLEDTHLGKDSILSPKQIEANRRLNGGFLSLDYVFEENFKKGIREHDTACYEEIRGMNMEAFVEYMMAKREARDPFELLKAEYAEAQRSIEKRRSVYWKEMLAILSFAMNYPAKYFSAEDMLRLQKTLMPLISVVIAFVPQSSVETLLALHSAGKLEMVMVDANEEPEPAENGGANYAEVHYPVFIDCIGQPHISFGHIPFEGLRDAGAPARLAFRDPNAGRELLKDGDQRITEDGQGNCYLTVPGLAINGHFQLMDEFNGLNERIYVMAVPFIAGFNPDYSGLDFGEAASGKIIERLLGMKTEPA
ncbi:FAD/NAD(P)-binding protein [Mucilaginibacter pedocola]|uniref:FAD-dependent urate hydroxylase HpyO/Asp monooxygenase CreE-like FAD/NAD(P)-binding domain-containing protein n=1 Tax=Mucilaginibacter pedocola TaxID=1792845 RepID=A0A1S9PHD5_9SPHI|nr:FAD/NAD(P)-binding protein [Mucilaginibacter pedocola]OOQ60372.1 hypothetical protein BC343_25460 [Mucilaginibacter pedocola]